MSKLHRILPPKLVLPILALVAKWLVRYHICAALWHGLNHQTSSVFLAYLQNWVMSPQNSEAPGWHMLALGAHVAIEVAWRFSVEFSQPDALMAITYHLIESYRQKIEIREGSRSAILPMEMKI